MPQMSTMKVLVQKSFKFGGFCTWPSLAVWHGLARLLGRVLCEKNEIYDFLRCESWNGLQMSTNEHHKILGARKF